MGSLRGTMARTALILMGLGAVARADDIGTILEEGRPCPLLFDFFWGGLWRNLSPTLNDLLLFPDFTFRTTGLA